MKQETAELKPFVVHLVRPAKGGMKNHVLGLVGGLKEKGYRLAVISPPNESLESKLRPLGVDLYEIQISDRPNPADLITIINLARLLRRLRPDILHIHGNKTALVGRMAAMLAGVPSTVVTVHNYLTYQNSHNLKQAAANLIERRLANRTDRIIAVSESLKDSLVNIEGLAPSKVVVIHNGIDLNHWTGGSKSEQELFRRELNLGLEDFIVFSAGRLLDWKGHEILIRAAAELAVTRSRFKLLIAGDGPLRSYLDQLVEELELQDSVKFLGHLPDIRHLMVLSDLFVLPSIKEPFGLVLLEAMAADLPIIATDAGGVSEIIANEQNGVLVPPGDVASLARAIEGLIGNATRRAELSAAGRQVVEEQFSMARLISRNEAVYGECFKNAGAELYLSHARDTTR
jgi:glycosyltransferase involved in cell wall biosynthesis